MLDINGALKAIGYGLLVLFFAVGVVKTCGSFTDVKRPEHALKLFDELCGVLGILYGNKEQNIDEEIEELIQKRTEARKNKDWATADKIRDELKARHVVLEDTPQGVKWHLEEV